MDLVWKAFPGSGTELLTMLAMADWCNDAGGSLYPSIGTVANRIRKSESQARRVLHKLIKEGWIRVVGNAFGGAPGSTRQYQLNVSRLAETGCAHATPRIDATPRMAAPDGPHGCAETGGAGASQTVKKQPLGNANKKHASPILGVAELVLEGVEHQHANDWLQVRRAKRAPLTITAWNALKIEASIAGITSAEAVRIAAARSWQTFKAEWLGNGHTTQAGKPKEAVTERVARINRERDTKEGCHALTR